MKTRNNPKEEKVQEVDYHWIQSQTSINIKEVKGIIFGGLSSRFWSFRKQLNLVDMSHHLESIKKQIPFYSWECLTIQCKDRDVDLVIRNEVDMQALLKFLYYHQSIRGKCGLDNETITRKKNGQKTNMKEVYHV